MSTTARPFQFEQSKLIKCAEKFQSASQSAAETTAAEATSIIKEEIEECHDLFQQHQSFYHRTSSHTEDENRFSKFMESVTFVYHHNQNYIDDKDSILHHVTLNQFSDLYDYELPLLNDDNGDYPLYDLDGDKDDDKASEGDTIISIDKESMGLRDPSHDSTVKSIANLFFKIKRHHHHHHHHKHELNHKTQNQSQQLDNNSIDVVQKNHNYLWDGLLDPNDTTETSTIRTPFVFEFNPDEDGWRSHLNWASKDNPDGVIIVRQVPDQGSCGSCWAFAATGTLEANTARTIAMEVFYNNLPSAVLNMSSLLRNNDTAFAKSQIRKMVQPMELQQAIGVAQTIESKVFEVANLSSQELVDCDTKNDLGCIGGNPVMAFPYIHKYGLVSSKVYPYYGLQNRKCERSESDKPVATCDSWGVLKPKEEDKMESALRHLGPISVGFNGGDKSFLYYSGGIYDSQTCSHYPNHAMLITGYGEEKRDDGKLTKYWIARNSWGQGWGENGFIRIKRKRNGSSGVCGIAKNPSIALGGSLIDADSYISQWQEESSLSKRKNDTLIQPQQMRLSSRIDVRNVHHQLYSSSSMLIGCGGFFVGIIIIFTLRRHTTRRSVSEAQLVSLEETQPSLKNQNGAQCYGSTVPN